MRTEMRAQHAIPYRQPYENGKWVTLREMSLKIYINIYNIIIIFYFIFIEIK